MPDVPVHLHGAVAWEVPSRHSHQTSVLLQRASSCPGMLQCIHNYQGQTGEMPLLIVEGTGLSLLGRDWLSHIQLNWREIHHAHSAPLQSVLACYASVF